MSSETHTAKPRRGSIKKFIKSLDRKRDRQVSIKKNPDQDEKIATLLFSQVDKSYNTGGVDSEQIEKERKFEHDKKIATDLFEKADASYGTEGVDKEQVKKARDEKFAHDVKVSETFFSN